MEEQKMGVNGKEQIDINTISEQVIGAAFEVSRVLGIGFLEKVYENAMVCEMRSRGLHAENQVQLQVTYKGQDVGHYIADIVVNHRLLVECKCVETFAPEHAAQCLNYLRGTGMRLALLLNFQNPKVVVKRVIL